MKKKYIITGLLVFLFSAISIYLVLDTGKETYAVENDGITEGENGSVVDDGHLNCESNGHGVWSNGQCICDEGYQLQTNGSCTATDSTCPPTSNIQVTIGQLASTGALQVAVDSSMSESCCKNTLGWSNYYAESGGTVCSTNITQSGSTYYYSAPSSVYCATGYTYNSSSKRCTKDGGNNTTPTCQTAQAYIDGNSTITVGITNTYYLKTKISTATPTGIEWTVSSGLSAVSTSNNTSTFKIKGTSAGSRKLTVKYKINGTSCTALTKTITVKESGGTGGTTTPTTYKLNYVCDTNDCTKMPSPNPQTSDTKSFPINTTTPERDGYQFLYWMINGGTYHYHPTCTGVSGTCKTEYTIQSSTLTTANLHAVWKKTGTSGDDTPEPTEPVDPVPAITEYSIHYDCGDDIECEGLPETTTSSNSVVAIDKTVPTREDGYKFKYWTSKVSKYKFCNPKTSDCDEYRIFFNDGVDSITLYANWEKIENDTPIDNPTPEKPTNPDDGVEPAQTGEIGVIIFLALGLGMLGYSYYYTKKLKEN